jgi:hypothetical protein
MKEYAIAGKKIQLDETKTYLDFYIQNGEPKLVSIDFTQLLENVQKGTIPAGKELNSYLMCLKRWLREAPRKRIYRGLREQGMTVVSGEYFFDGDGGDKIIDNLENTGKLAEYLLRQIFGGYPIVEVIDMDTHKNRN